LLEPTQDRYDVSQLKMMNLEALIRIILLLQEENDTLRNQIEFLLQRIQGFESKEITVIQLKT
jgi:hypothetical protein